VILSRPDAGSSGAWLLGRSSLPNDPEHDIRGQWIASALAARNTQSRNAAHDAQW
jgi:hypothetical protein